MNALKNCDGIYGKGFSAGDQLYGVYSLRDWVDYIKSAKSKWCICDIVCYHNESGTDVVDSVPKHPFFLLPYRKKWDFAMRFNYVCLMDIANASSILCELEFIKNILEKLEDHVKYAEDNLWRIAMYNGYVPSYYPKVCVKYEYGTGVSTNPNSPYADALKADFKYTINLIKETKPKDAKQRALRLGLMLSQVHFIGAIICHTRTNLGKMFPRNFYTINEFPKCDNE